MMDGPGCKANSDAIDVAVWHSTRRLLDAKTNVDECMGSTERRGACKPVNLQSALRYRAGTSEHVVDLMAIGLGCTRRDARER
jgi:hypothetical protein